MLLFSCSWEEYDETKGQTEDSSVADIEIVAAEDLAFPPAGGMGTITLKSGTGVSVETNRSWCHAVLNGNVVNISSDQNPSKQSRYARVTITAGGESIYVTVQQYGEVFSGLEMTDFIAPCEGTDMTLSFLSNMEVNLTSDKDWVSFVKDDEAKTVKIVVAENPGQETRFANIGFTSGTVTGSAKVTQAPTPKSVESWTFAVTGGQFVFPDQIDQITATPGKDVAMYVFTVVGKNDIEGDLDEYIQEDYMPGLITDLVANEPDKLLVDEVTQEYTNLGASVYAIAVGFDKEGYITGQYGYQELSIPDRGPVKTLVDGWDVTMTSSDYSYPDQTNVFSIAPKSGYESVKYLVTAVSKDAISSTLEDYVFNTFTLPEREAILSKVQNGEIASFDDALYVGPGTFTSTNVKGDCYVVIVAFDDHQFYQGDYTAVEMTIDDIEPTYYKWAGNWLLEGKYFDGEDYSETITISIDESDKDTDGKLMERRLIMTGFLSKAAGLWGAPASVNAFYLKFDATSGAITFYGQNSTGTFTYSGLGDGCKLQLMSMYTKKGASSYTNATGYDFLSATLDGETGAKITILERSSGLPWQVARIRCYYSSSAYTITATNNASILLDDSLSMTRVK